MNITTNAAELRITHAPLFHRYPCEGKAQPAHILIDPVKRTAIAGWDSNSVDGAWRTRDEACKRVLGISVPNLLSGAQIADFLSSADVVSEISRICDGFSGSWDGQNHVGALDQDAEEALERLTRLASDLSPDLTAWKTCDWLQDFRVEKGLSDQQISSVAADVLNEAIGEGVILDGNVASFIREKSRG